MSAVVTAIDLGLIKLELASKHKVLNKSLEIVQKFVEVKDSEKNTEEIIEALINVKKKNSAILKHLLEYTQKTISNTSGKLLYDVIKSIT